MKATVTLSQLPLHARRPAHFRHSVALALLTICVAATAAANDPALCPYPPSAADAPKGEVCEAKLDKKNPDIRDTVLKCAATAQGQVDKLSQQLKDLYDVVNTAAATALKLESKPDKLNTKTAARTKRSVQEALPGKGAKSEQTGMTVSELLWCSQDMRQRAEDARGHLSKSQKQASDYVDAALALKSSPTLQGANDLAAVGSLVDQHNAMIDSITLARETNDALRELALRLKVDPTWTGPDAAEALRFARLMRDFPDAKSSLGGDSYLISAGTAKAEAALRLSWQADLPVGIRKLSAVVSTPLGDSSTKAKLYDRADGLAGTAQVTLGADTYQLKPSTDYLAHLGAGVTIGYDTRTYLVDGVAPREETSRVHPLGLTLSAAWFNVKGGNRDSHFAKASWQRTYKDGKNANRCPVPAASAVFVDCLTGPVGAPTPASAGVFSYQYRSIWAMVALAPQISFNTRSRVIDLDLPIYLVRDETQKERPFTAGVSLGWVSKGKTELTDRTSGKGNIGVFIGAPLSLLE